MMTTTRKHPCLSDWPPRDGSMFTLQTHTVKTQSSLSDGLLIFVHTLKIWLKGRNITRQWKPLITGMTVKSISTSTNNSLCVHHVPSQLTDAASPPSRVCLVLPYSIIQRLKTEE